MFGLVTTKAKQTKNKSKGKKKNRSRWRGKHTKSAAAAAPHPLIPRSNELMNHWSCVEERRPFFFPTWRSEWFAGFYPKNHSSSEHSRHTVKEARIPVPAASGTFPKRGGPGGGGGSGGLAATGPTSRLTFCWEDRFLKGPPFPWLMLFCWMGFLRRLFMFV